MAYIVTCSTIHQRQLPLEAIDELKYRTRHFGAVAQDQAALIDLDQS